MMYEKRDIRQLQAVLTDEERVMMQRIIQRSGMKQKYWLRKIILDAITTNKQEAHYGDSR